MEKLTCEKTRAAYLLSDEIFGAFRGAQLANHLLNSAMDFRLDDEEIDDTDQYVDATDQYTLRATFKELVWRMDIMCHYLCEARGDLYLLDTAARKYKPEKAAFKAAPPKVWPKSDAEILARVKEIVTELDSAAQQRVLEIFGEKLNGEEARHDEL